MMFAWETKLRLLGVYILLLAILHVFVLVTETSRESSSLFFMRWGLLLISAVPFEKSVPFFEQIFWSLLAVWLVIIGALMMLGRPLLRTYIGVETLLAIPTAFFSVGYTIAGPGFHTGSREEHMQMLFMLLISFLLPVAAAFHLLWQRKKPATDSERTITTLKI